jgi:hypothetical protein
MFQKYSVGKAMNSDHSCKIMPWNCKRTFEIPTYAERGCLWIAERNDVDCQAARLNKDYISHVQTSLASFNQRNMKMKKHYKILYAYQLVVCTVKTIFYIL